MPSPRPDPGSALRPQSASAVDLAPLVEHVALDLAREYHGLVALSTPARRPSPDAAAKEEG